jgi:hypothetical protein
MQILPAGDTGSSAAAGAARPGLDGTGSETGLNAGHSQAAAGRPGSLHKGRTPG